MILVAQAFEDEDRISTGGFESGGGECGLDDWQFSQCNRRDRLQIYISGYCACGHKQSAMLVSQRQA